MNVLPISRLLARRSIATTIATLLAVVVAMLFTKRGSIYTGNPVQVYYSLVYEVLTIGSLISFGGFIAKVTSELEGVRLCRTIPGLRRRITTGVLLIVPFAASCATGFVYLSISGFEVIHLFPLWLASAFLFCLGFSLGWSWLLFIALAGLLFKVSWISEELRRAPVLGSLVMTGGCLGLLGIRHRLFLSPVAQNRPAFSQHRWLAASLAIGPTLRRDELDFRVHRGWDGPTASVSISKLVRAGVFERLGHLRGRLLGRVLLSVAVLYAIFATILVWAASGQKPPGLAPFAAQVFTSDAPDAGPEIMRVMFAAITGCIAYVGALLLDTSLRPNLWHPISRAKRSQSIFLSHLRQNVIFAGVHLSFSFLMLLGLSTGFHTPLGLDAVNAFLAPIVLAFVLMPLPQAMFPNGVETFRNKVNPLLQLVAGIAGGAFSLGVAYWTSYWPMKGWHRQLTPEVRAVLLLMLGGGIYGAYYFFLRARYRRIDFRGRTA